MRYLYLIIGRSGSGKTELTEALAERIGAKLVRSYTTRQKRDPNETNHIFAEKTDYFKAKKQGLVVAETFFSGNFYWAQTDQLENSDIYVVDPKGEQDVRKAYENGILKKEPFAIKLAVARKEAERRMRTRGDLEGSVQTRLTNDDIVFKDFHYDAKIDANKSKEEMIDAAIAIINEQEQKK